jgi:hypothetical protein
MNLKSDLCLASEQILPTGPGSDQTHADPWAQPAIELPSRGRHRLEI